MLPIVLYKMQYFLFSLNVFFIVNNKPIKYKTIRIFFFFFMDVVFIVPFLLNIAKYMSWANIHNFPFNRSLSISFGILYLVSHLFFTSNSFLLNISSLNPAIHAQVMGTLHLGPCLVRSSASSMPSSGYQ